MQGLLGSLELLNINVSHVKRSTDMKVCLSIARDLDKIELTLLSPNCNCPTTPSNSIQK